MGDRGCFVVMQPKLTNLGRCRSGGLGGGKFRVFAIFSSCFVGGGGKI